MQDVTTLPDSEIHSRLVRKSREERELQAEVLHLLREVERRRLYADFEYSSTFVYCVKHLKYSEGAASRRIAAMRALGDLPAPAAIEQSLKERRVNLCALAQAGRFFRDERVQRGRVHTAEQKAAVVEQLLDLSGGDRDRLFAKLAPDALPSERERVLTEEHTELRAVLDQKTLEGLKRLQELWSHSLKERSYSELIARMTEFVLAKVDPERRPKPATQRFAAAAKQCSKIRARSIPAPLRREALQRDGHACSFVNAESGQRCGSMHYVQADHVIPFARGGTNELGNLRTLCRNHNLRKAILDFGERKMTEFLGQRRV